MTNSILHYLTEQYSSFTRSEKKLANYILSHSTEAQYLSINSMAENSAVSEATITRFCRKLGLSGYNSLKLALAKSDPVSGSTPTASSGDMNTDNGLRETALQLCNTYEAALRETANLIDPVTFNQAVELLVNARHVYCFGHGGSMVIAMEACARFSVCSSSFIHIADSHMQAMAIALSSSKDVIWYFSYSGATKEYYDLAKIAKDHHVPIILITHFKNSSAARIASVVLLCGYNESPLLSGSVPAKMGQLLLIDCLYTAFYEKNANADSASAATADAIAQKHL